MKRENKTIDLQRQNIDDLIEKVEKLEKTKQKQEQLIQQ